jgi:hypothetical protein
MNPTEFIERLGNKFVVGTNIPVARYRAEAEWEISGR